MTEYTEPATLDNGNIQLHLPALPKKLVAADITIKHLSQSSVNKYLDCPTSWAYKYVAAKKDSLGWPVIIGSIVDNAVESYYKQAQAGQRPKLASITDEYYDRFNKAIDTNHESKEYDLPLEEKDWQISRGSQVLTTYINEYGQNNLPVTLQPEYRQRLHPNIEWDLLGYLDYELENNIICDLKTGSAAYTELKSMSHIQPTFYYLLKFLAGEKVTQFEFHSAYYGRGKQKISAGFTQIVTHRTQQNMQSLVNTIASIANQIVTTDTNYPEQEKKFGDRYFSAFPRAAMGSFQCNPKQCKQFSNCGHVGTAEIAAPTEHILI